MKVFSISNRIALMVGISAFVLLVVGLIGLSVIHTEEASIQRLHDHSIKSVITLTDARQSFTEVRVFAYKVIVLSGNERQTSKTGLNQRIESSLNSLQDYASLASTAEDKQFLEEESAKIKDYFTLLQGRILPLTDTSPEEAAHLLATQGAAAGQVAIDMLEKHVELNRRLADEAAASALASARSGRNLSIVCFIAGLLLISCLGFFLARDIRFRLIRLSQFLDTASATLDFTRRIPIVRKDEVGTAGNAANALLGRLQENLKSISASANSVAAAAEQLATSSSQVATASGQQSEAASNVAATIEEMTVSINHVGEEAQTADRLSKESAHVASNGGRIILQTANDINSIAHTVHSAADLIHGLETNSQKVSGVMQVIKEVADQTNLLALNAAIEAARAGEQGRGFAVVADEVRKLAERTAKSTQEITNTVSTMITNAAEAATQMQAVVEQVNVGVQSAQAISQSIRQIEDGCNTAVSTVEEISNAICEQGAATNNIAVQVEKIAQMSEESSAAAAESSEAAGHLDTLAREMLQIVRAYRLA